MALCLPAMAQPVFPIKNGKMQSDMNAAGFNITNLGGLFDTSGNPMIGAGGGTNGITYTNNAGRAGVIFGNFIGTNTAHLAGTNNLMDATNALTVTLKAADTVVSNAMVAADTVKLDATNATAYFDPGSYFNIQETGQPAPSFSLGNGAWTVRSVLNQGAGDGPLTQDSDGDLTLINRSTWAQSASSIATALTNIGFMGDITASSSNNILAVTTNMANTLNGARILRGTNIFRYGNIAQLTSTVASGDTVELYGTNFLTASFWSPPNVVWKSTTERSKTVLVQSNYFIGMTNNVRFQDITFFNPLTNQGTFHNTNAALGYAGTNHCTNVVVERCDFFNANGNINFSGEDSGNAGVVNLEVNECYFDSAGMGLRISSCSSNSFIRIRNSRFKSVWSPINAYAAMCCLRLNAGTNLLENVTITAQNCPGENIGIYLYNAVAYFSGVKFIDCVVTNGALGPLNLLLQASSSQPAAWYDLDGCIKPSDVQYHSAEDTVEAHPFVASGAVSTTDLIVNSDVSMSSAYSGYNDLSSQYIYWNERTNWMRRMSEYNYASNSFAALPQILTNNISITNYNGIAYTLYATNGLALTNDGSAVVLTTQVTNDIIILTNRGSRIASPHLIGGRFDSSYNVLVTSNVNYSFVGSYWNISGTNLVTTNVVHTDGDPISTTAQVQYWNTNFNMEVIKIEPYTSASTRRLFLRAIEVYSGTNQRSAKLSLKTPARTLNTNAVYVSGAGTSGANGTYLRKAADAFTNTVGAYYITNAMNQGWEIHGGAGNPVRYVIPDLSSDYAVTVQGIAPAPHVTYGQFATFTETQVASNAVATVATISTLNTSLQLGNIGSVNYLTNTTFLYANSGVWYPSNTFNLTTITNSLGNFGFWVGNSNGVPTMVYLSNGVAFFKDMR